MEEKYVILKIEQNKHGDKMIVKLKIKEIRSELGYTLEKMAEITGVSKSHLNYLEKGEKKATIDVLCQIADRLHLEVTELFEVLK